MKLHNCISLNIVSTFCPLLVLAIKWFMESSSGWFLELFYICFSLYTGVFLFLFLFIPELIMRIWKPNLLPQIVYPAKFKIFFTILFYICLSAAIAIFGYINYIWLTLFVLS